jgi:hypothetical protein
MSQREIPRESPTASIPQKCEKGGEGHLDPCAVQGRLVEPSDGLDEILGSLEILHADVPLVANRLLPRIQNRLQVPIDPLVARRHRPKLTLLSPPKHTQSLHLLLTNTPTTIKHPSIPNPPSLPPSLPPSQSSKLRAAGELHTTPPHALPPSPKSAL